MAIYGKKELDFIFTEGLKTDELGKQEQERIYQYDCEQREIIANDIVTLALENIDSEQIKTITKSGESAKRFYQSQFDKYLNLKSYLTREIYTPCDFWFNDAGFQYKWRKSDRIIVLECFSWNEVAHRVRQAKGGIINAEGG